MTTGTKNKVSESRVSPATELHMDTQQRSGDGQTVVASSRPRSRTLNGYHHTNDSQTPSEQQAEKRSKLKIELPSPPSLQSPSRPFETTWKRKPGTPFVRAHTLPDLTDDDEDDDAERTLATVPPTTMNKSSLSRAHAIVNEVSNEYDTSGKNGKDSIVGDKKDALVSADAPYEGASHRVSSPPCGTLPRSSIRKTYNDLPSPALSRPKANAGSERASSSDTKSSAPVTTDTITTAAESKLPKEKGCSTTLPDIVINPPALVPDVEPIRSIHAKAIKDVPLKDLDPKLRAEWLVEVDVDDLIRRHAVDEVILAKREQERLALAYWKWRVKRDAKAADPNTMVAWSNTVMAIGELPISERNSPAYDRREEELTNFWPRRS